MQTAENRTVSLRAIDGRLAGLCISALHGGQRDDKALIASIGQLVDAAGAATRVECHPHDAAADTGIVFEIEGTNAAAGHSGTTITRLRSFYPIVRSRLPELDLALVSVDAPVADDSAIELACQYARRFGRQRIDVIPPAQGVAQAVEDVDRRLDEWRTRFPDIEFHATPVARIIGHFAAGKTSADVVVAPSMFAEIIQEVAGTLSGAPGLATVSQFDSGSLSVRASADGESPAAALILAVADLLVWAGRADASGRIVNAWARTLEHGCHTTEFSVMSPYSRQLDAEEFTTVVASRLHDRPQTLKPRQPGSDAPKIPRGRRHLRLVGAGEG